MNSQIKEIRENERKSHIDMYSHQSLYKSGSWLQRPVKTVMELVPLFRSHTQLRILDLGCGVGRNSIAIARHLSHLPCVIDCVDILDLAIEKLDENASVYDVSNNIHGIAEAIESFTIAPNHYDWIIAVSALEHVDSEVSFRKKLLEIRDGIRGGGIVCLIINSSITERRQSDGQPVPAQFEVNLPAEVLQLLLFQTFAGWNVLEFTVKPQEYSIPRDFGICQLQADVVTFVARKHEGGDN